MRITPAFVVAAALASPAALADAGRGITSFTISQYFNRVESWDAQGSANNTILSTPPGETRDAVTGIGWDLAIETVGESWRSEVVFRFYNSDDETLLTLRPGVADESPGSTFYTSNGVVDLTDNGMDNWNLRDGPIFLEIYEFYDDVQGAFASRRRR